MAEYINKADIETVYCFKSCEECRNEMCPSELFGGLPTIDIIRCSECKHKGNEITTGQIYCGINHYPHYPDYFCADGERKE